MITFIGFLSVLCLEGSPDYNRVVAYLHRVQRASGNAVLAAAIMWLKKRKEHRAAVLTSGMEDDNDG